MCSYGKSPDLSVGVITLPRVQVSALDVSEAAVIVRQVPACNQKVTCTFTGSCF